MSWIQETREAFETATNILKEDYMYMGKCTRFMYFEHAVTRRTIEIPTAQYINHISTNQPTGDQSND